MPIRVKLECKINFSMNIKWILLCSFSFFITNILAQERIDWTVLADVQFEKVYVEELGLTHEEATFGALVSPLDEKR